MFKLGQKYSYLFSNINLYISKINHLDGSISLSWEDTKKIAYSFDFEHFDNHCKNSIFNAIPDLKSKHFIKRIKNIEGR